MSQSGLLHELGWSFSWIKAVFLDFNEKETSSLGCKSMTIMSILRPHCVSNVIKGSYCKKILRNTESPQRNIIQVRILKNESLLRLVANCKLKVIASKPYITSMARYHRGFFFWISRQGQWSFFKNDLSLGHVKYQYQISSNGVS